MLVREVEVPIQAMRSKEPYFVVPQPGSLPAGLPKAAETLIGRASVRGRCLVRNEICINIDQCDDLKEEM